jgi:hypothetical protein
MKQTLFSLFAMLLIASCSKPSSSNLSNTNSLGVFKYEVITTGSHWNAMYRTADGGSSQMNNGYSYWTYSDSIKSKPFEMDFNAVIDSPLLGGKYIVNFYYNNTKVKVDSFTINGQTNIADMNYIIN